MITDIIQKIRDVIEDNLRTDGNYTDVYYNSKVFTLPDANVVSSSIVVHKNGALWLITPVAGSGVAWTRAGTVITITKTAHGLITGDLATITASSDVTALPLGVKTVTKLTDNTFTITGLNAGASSGTCTYTVIANYSYSSTTGKLTITGTLVSGDSLQVVYSYYSNHSDTELRGRIRASAVYISAGEYKTFVIKDTEEPFPTPTAKEESLLALVAGILIKPNITSYRTPDLTITFPNRQSKEDKIKEVINRYKKAYGYLGYINPGEKIETELED